MELRSQIHEYGRRAKAAARQLARASAAQKDDALRAMAAQVEHDAPQILTANARDVAAAQAAGLSAAMIDRLTLTEKRLRDMAEGIRTVAALPQPVGEIIRAWTRPNGLEISKVRVPIGVVGIIFESRPNVTSDAAILCLKTGNATLLRGGSEAIHSNLAIAEALRTGLTASGLPADAVILLPMTDREAVRHLAEMDNYLDVIVPRGGQALIEAVMEHARMPVIKHYHGVCHIYVDEAADLKMAQAIVLNAKCQRPGVCNAMETLLVHRKVASKFLAQLSSALAKENVTIHADAESWDQLSTLNYQPLQRATESSWTTEYLDLALSLRIVENLDAALDHLEHYGSHHSDAIVTENEATAQRFLAEVDSATVYWNASTRFTDGGEFGFGAEIGISTDKLHARGPMALEELTTYKYTIKGSGQIRS